MLLEIALGFLQVWLIADQLPGLITVDKGFCFLGRLWVKVLFLYVVIVHVYIQSLNYVPDARCWDTNLYKNDVCSQRVYCLVVTIVMN